ncbi:MAG: hypothetical protein ACLTA9_12915 [Clostridium saudiense]|jgi:hypothetical protein|uniref:hypothetical protein n=1 Tax=Clostridium saudiense TaxID=1414720 RepID=UPI00290B4D14|nr:hypothetical protein [Clostridium saudiense]MDU7453085.1 hypothetical protein [Clostridium saudiense]
MFITSCNLRKRIGMGRLLQADGGAGIAGEGNPSGDEGDPEAGEGKGEEAKTFTQEELDKIVKERVARAKKDQPSKEELEAFKQWQESQKTEEEKKNEALTNAETARVAAEERALLAETKVTCLSKGVVATSIDDVVILAKAMVNDDLTMEQAIDKVLEKYPSFKGEKEQQEQNQNGFIIGANNKKQKVNPNDAIARAFGIK